LQEDYSFYCQKPPSYKIIVFVLLALNLFPRDIIQSIKKTFLTRKHFLNEAGMEIISIDELHDKVVEMGENSLILDVRSPEEYSAGCIPGSQNTPHEEVSSIAGELKVYDKVYVHCKMGGRAKMASQALINAGLDNIVCVGNGGMERWMQMGWPVQK
jgi:phage shock protein E